MEIMDRELGEIKNRLVQILGQILADESDDFTVDTSRSLVEEYGLDSLDLLDFSFNIEVEYDVKIGPNELSLKAKDRISQDQVLDEDGYLTQMALDELKASVPEIPSEMFRHGLRQGDVPRLLNIDVFARLVHEKLKGDK
ncbi:MAG: hypothetical protein CVV64_00130 [Candidatus Wallbacteria bacterium HGW-Wallbacteria-1]|jgi:acyl carrier protein|uniref:Carrier domain-containing protein n=1 Tax=Candidatus Wallbacteria bacterium HGW-Wallbacteria-1 TaxID=2013854 RepID=A0A2N1PU53_9BACT|nr:MAG: hypothetical protein CVV64_00130 [Candidatus Wallbacteria bacterium HGW-Wallbacteria-1]